MFKLIDAIRTRILISKVQKYVNEHFSENISVKNKKFDPDIQCSMDYDPQSVPKERHSDNNIPSINYIPPGSKVKYSLRDGYDSSMVKKTMQSISSSPASRILKELDETTNMSFVDKMLEHINKRHMKDPDVYKAAQIDRRLFSKLISNKDYKPAKDTCIACALALNLSLEEALDLLSRAGYTLSHSNKRDIVIEYFFREMIYDINDINAVLYQLDQKLIGR